MCTQRSVFWARRTTVEDQVLKAYSVGTIGKVPEADRRAAGLHLLRAGAV
jgi:hypothetical protein